MLGIEGLAAENWLVFNNKSDTHNPAGHYLMLDAPNAQNDHSGGNDVDFLASGFKLRSTNTATNGSSDNTYAFAAWAESPFASNNRAR